MRPASFRLVVVGAFVLVGLGLFAVGLFMIGDRRLIFAEHFEVFTEFTTVTGLAPGATVRVAGLNAGEVLEILVPVRPEERFRVRMRVREDLHALVRADSVAAIRTEGLIGSRYVQIERGSTGAAPIADGGTIPGREPFELTDLLEQASETVGNLNDTIADLGEDLKATIAVTAETVRDVDALVDEVEEEVTLIARSGRRMTEDIESIVRDVRDGRGTVGRLVNDDALYRRATQIAAEAEETMRNVRQATEEAREALAGLRSQDLPGGGVVTDLRRTLDAAREAMGDLADATEALKHNWFLRGFFRDRGYFDLNTLGVQEYREGALEQGDRRALRIWIDARYLFVPEPGRDVVLTEDGRARLDSAMSELLRHPRDTLLMVEGYSEAPTRDERFLDSRARAAAARDYLIERYQLDPNRIGLMPMGLEAPDSPREDDRWAGIALAAFVQRSGSR